jgi:hypothetical protein
MEEPKRVIPDTIWQYFDVWDSTKSLLYSIPNHFQSDLSIRGVNVTEIFSVGALFSGILETQIVDTLNRLRGIWDKDAKYFPYSFIRQPQNFPDVLLMKTAGGEEVKSKDILFGIELKSWYILSKEGEPSFRYQITPAACADADLLVIVPWILSDVVSGSPKLFQPWIESARYVAEHRNFYWQKSRKQRNKNPNIRTPKDIKHYPDIRQEAADEAEEDKGGNFGRIARTNIINQYINSLKDRSYLGIKISHWIEFLKAVSDTSADIEIERKIRAIKEKVQTREDCSERSGIFLEIMELVEKLWRDNLC